MTDGSIPFLLVPTVRYALAKRHYLPNEDVGVR